jgi:hypothetical protein
VKFPFESVTAVADVITEPADPYPEVPGAMSLTVAPAIGCWPPWTLPEMASVFMDATGDGVVIAPHPVRTRARADSGSSKAVLKAGREVPAEPAPGSLGAARLGRMSGIIRVEAPELQQNSCRRLRKRLRRQALFVLRNNRNVSSKAGSENNLQPLAPDDIEQGERRSFGLLGATLQLGDISRSEV